MLGDKVPLGDDDGGVVVCSIDTREYSAAAPEAEWSYLKKGVVIKFPKFGLIRYETAEPDLGLIARGADATLVDPLHKDDDAPIARLGPTSNWAGVVMDRRQSELSAG